MKNRIVSYCLLGLLFLLANKTDVFAWSCCKSTASTGECGSCTVSGGRDPVTLAQRCGEGAPWCQTATPNCGNGWSSSCSSGNCDSCTLTCTDCDNPTTCYKPKAVTCNKTCPSGTAHKFDGTCSNGGTRDDGDCTDVSGCPDPYNCCTCLVPISTTPTPTTTGTPRPTPTGTLRPTPTRTPNNNGPARCAFQVGYSFTDYCAYDPAFWSTNYQFCSDGATWVEDLDSNCWDWGYWDSNLDSFHWSCVNYDEWRDWETNGGNLSIYCCRYYPLSPSVGSDGECNAWTTDRFRTLSSEPDISSRCYKGTPSAVTPSGNTWLWSCIGTSGQCGGDKGSDVNCFANRNSPPKFEWIKISNPENGFNLIPVEIELGVGTSRNQICDTAFNGSRKPLFEVHVSDPDYDSPLTVSLKWNNNTINQLFSYTDTNISGFSWLDSSKNYIPIPNSLNDNVAHPLMVTITDPYGNTTGEINTGRYFKIWDCNVPISGTIYDSTDNGGNADYSTGIGFSNPADPAVLKFSSLDFIGGGISVGMTVNSPNYNSVTNHHLTWGVNTYVPNFNGDISLTSPKIRYKNAKSGSSWNGNTNAYVDTIGIVDPYDVASIGITADFSGILIQDPWWQANGGGVISNTSITGQVPATCTETNSCISQIGISGLVSAPSISNVGNPSYQNWYYGSTSGLPNNNAKLADSNTNYSYFYSQYFVKKGVGTTFSGNKSISDIVDTGIYFIEGNLNIDTDKTLTNPSDFLMIIVSGDINVGIGASRVDGILVANNIGASGASDNQLIFNGSLYAADSVNFSRDYDINNRINNNSTPVVVVNYDPKLIFNMPGDIAKVLTNWQWGN